MTSTQLSRRGRPPALTREQVEDAAFALVQAHGYDSSSMRELARHLGVSAMAVQRISGGREVLDEALVSRLVESQRRPASEWPSQWDGILVEYAHLMRELCRRHPAVLAAFSRRPLTSPYAQEVVDLVLASLTQEGLTSQQAATAFMAVRDYVTGHVSIESQRTHGQALDVISELDSVHAAARWLARPDAEEQFTAGLDLLLAGIRQRIENA
jgi:AcrR family transcriptional regulator